MSETRHLSLCQSCYQQKDIRNARPFHDIDGRFANASYAPSDTEIVHLEELMASEKDELARYQDEIKILRRKLEKLETGERRLKQNIATRRSALSSQRRVPVEIWETIFIFVCESNYDYSLEIDYDLWSNTEDTPVLAHTYALTLSQVCARWRKIVNGYPRLWSSIKIQLDVPTTVVPPLEIYLERSREHPLSLQLCFLDADDYHLHGELQADKRDAWKLLCPHFARTRELVLGIANVEDMPLVPNLTFPSLTSFTSLASRSVIGTEMQNSFWHAVEGASQLTDVFLSMLLPSDWLPYRWLQSLNIQILADTESIEALFHILLHCTSLVSLTLGSPALDKGQPIPLVLQRPIELSSLRHLAIEDTCGIMGSDATFFPVCCPQLVLPGLTSFTLDSGGWPPALSTLLQRCATTLEKLTVDMYRCEDDSHSRASDVLRFLSHLEHLTMDIGRESGVLTTFLSRLQTKDSDRNSFLPNLQSVHVKAVEDWPSVAAEVVKRTLDAVSSRRGSSTVGSCSLTYFRLTPAPTWPPGRVQPVVGLDALEKLKFLRKDGIYVVFDDPK